ncbi:RelA/SpoT family protein [Pseudanabaena mucicola]|uniref:Bifunctional (P)ppGpp synthetase/guanosine-3',5'-bis(Diphosphate) 3'-pyrophosphohydrolase n=1 Tax=Pseudanabaena mucicola FACHB-723 TaxID=2692860 RepID=A0ABR7ZWP1_9CYAN|nr:bifunctional (p)ppGpp synthetase/guanosine-3',5'-bis(diphosphate) 3'-pyrophosphohydrolase [Pseudanabaena mucicola]MBD2187925.1 bifunctional (p)ppGpp synthetase/guanosine-3',5'-bis(diphosphate) 3'-pyrophosphohydrolase [Pseudanabaena mucicola FACHB-723]
MTPITLLAEAPVEHLGNPVDVEVDSEQVGECNAVVDAWIPDWLRGGWEKSQRREILEQEDIVSRALDFAYRLHDGQCRASGEPYILHPIAVASILKDLGGSDAMIAAGFLHDVVEDTEVSCEQIEEMFGKEVRQLVEGVTKLSKLSFANKTESQAENFRRMFLAMAQDIRVIIVKLADRLHNMRTLQHLRPEKQVLISRETREIFAPLANRLGLGQIKWELEDIAFKYIEPEQYQMMESLVAETHESRQEQLTEVTKILGERLADMGIEDFEISGRPKHLYGIYRKMERQKKQYNEIYDIQAVRVIVNTKEECYRVLAVVHDYFCPIPGRFKDYIGLPKPNRYQSLHTAVIGPKGQPVEVQIRTWEMHHIADYGIAAHWKYKESNSESKPLKGDDQKFTWLRQLVEWQRELNDPQEYLDSVKEDLFDSEVYVFSPKGDVYCLPRGATPVDFAYRVHTEVGNHCSGALVNNVMVPLQRPLKHGDIVTILTQNNAHPSTDWMNFVATSSAKSRIRQWFKRSRRDENLALGRSALERELGKAGLEALLKSDQMQKLAERCNYHNVEDLIAGIGYGETSVNAVVNKLREHQHNERGLHSYKVEPRHQEHVHSHSHSKSPILGLDGMVYSIAGCCTPLPGEPIAGVVALGSNRGITIHRHDCHNLTSIPADRLLHVGWNQDKEHDHVQTYPIDIRVEVIDRVGILRDILSRLSDNKINVRRANVQTKKGKAAIIDLSIDICDRNQFDRVCNQINKLCDILSVSRVVAE